MGTQEILQGVVRNDLSKWEIGDRFVTGLIGEHPSDYSKSPAMWNNVYRNPELFMDVRYVPFDLGALAGGKADLKALEKFVGVVRNSGKVLGFNVTMPYKLAILEYLDWIDSVAEQIGAVNTVVVRDGKLYGYSTDGVGEVDNLLISRPIVASPFIRSLSGTKVVVLGAGGASNAVTYAISDGVGGGGVIKIANRTVDKAVKLAEQIFNFYKERGVKLNILGGGEEKILEYLEINPDLIINTSTKGNSGEFEKYSAIVPAYPGDEGVKRNNEESLELFRKIPKSTKVADIVYSPKESVFLRHARETGHQILNGEGMLLFQGVNGFMIIHKDEIEKRYSTLAEAKEEITRLMYKGLIRE